MPRYLLDANILSEPVRQKPNRLLMERLESELDDCATAALVLHELEFGVLRLPASRRKTILTEYLAEVVSQIPVLGYDATCAHWHARERARLERRGAPAPFVDGQIAAIAAVNGLVLATRNTEDFARFEGLEVEDWTRVD